MKKVKISILLVLGVGIVLGIMIAQNNPKEVKAAGGEVADSKGTAPERYVYYPGTEPLKPEEIRLIACGTGLPAARRDQAATCFLAELGNGEKFLFDVGTGSGANLAALMIPYDFLDKIFLTHLHTDHWGDLATIWAGGWTAGRTKPLRIWGPKGQTPDMGTAYAVEHFLKAYNWDAITRNFFLSPEPGKIIVKECDYKGVNAVVYDENGVTIRTVPAIHAGDGPVSFILEYAGLKVIIGGDTFPNKWYIKYAVNADLAIHETFLTPPDLVKMYGQSPSQAILCRYANTYFTSGIRQGHERDQAPPCGGLSLLLMSRPPMTTYSGACCRPIRGRCLWRSTIWSGTSPKIKSRSGWSCHLIRRGRSTGQTGRRNRRPGAPCLIRSPTSSSQAGGCRRKKHRILWSRSLRKSMG